MFLIVGTGLKNGFLELRKLVTETEYLDGIVS